MLDFDKLNSIFMLKPHLRIDTAVICWFLVQQPPIRVNYILYLWQNFRNFVLVSVFLSVVTIFLHDGFLQAYWCSPHSIYQWDKGVSLIYIGFTMDIFPFYRYKCLPWHNIPFILSIHWSISLHFLFSDPITLPSTFLLNGNFDVC